ncbi:hypothetical protein ACS0TY_014729 [Phlomoides rotata]
MASKFGLAGGIPERRALKALILERMGKNEEALSVCLNAKEILCSDNSNVYVDDALCRLFSSGLITIAIKMYKTAGEERFSLWAVCSIQLQVCCGNGGDKLFLLAEGLLKKHIASHGLHEPEALSVYVSLLEQQRKYSDALEILSGNLGSLMMIEVDKLRLHGRLLARAGDYGAAADVFQKVLEHCPFKVQNLIGDVFALPVDELEDIAVRMTEMFCKNLPLSKDLDAQESMHGKELLSMTCNILVQHNLIKQSEANALKTVEKRSLLPRMIYLSISSAPASVKENIEANGSIADTKFSLDLKILLERYAKILEFPLHDAIELVFGVSSGKKPLEALSSETTDWMNFTVFLNAWNLSSHEIGFPDGGNSDRSTWDLVNTLLKKYVLETMKSAGPIISSPGNNILLLVQLVTEPLTWHSLIIQSCIRSLLPSGKKKKKGALEFSALT